MPLPSHDHLAVLSLSSNSFPSKKKTHTHTRIPHQSCHKIFKMMSYNTFYSVAGLVLALRTLGPALGFALGSGCLSLYIDPTVTPLITNKDPRWLGAWWLGNSY